MNLEKNFALIGALGYIAPRHMQAIIETGNQLVSALDPYVGIGIMDSYFLKVSFFTEFERFMDKYHRENDRKSDYMSLTTPNYLHDAYIRFTLKSGCDAICEKPLVLNPHNINQLKIIEQETGKKVNNILQLRLYPSIIALKEKVAKELKDNPNKIYNIDLTYLTSRGKWYFVSWKGDEGKSGGIGLNTGVHFYDILSWVFGEVKENIVHLKTPDANTGMLVLKNTNVQWFLSINYDYIPENVKAAGQTTFRSIRVNGDEIEFSGGFKDLHTRSYEEILSGNGFGLDKAYGSIRTVSSIRNQDTIGLKGEYHPFAKKVR